MSRQLKISLCRAEQEKQAMKRRDVNRPDRHLFNRHSDGTGNEERPLQYESEPARRRLLSS
ncbi:hypothetical protein ECZC10_54490 [Escherichia coli]|nr:hypothetical protein ECZC10_54490 [Escherichia coli]